MNILTNKAESFVAINDADNNVIIFTCHINIECLCDGEEILKFLFLSGWRKRYKSNKFVKESLKEIAQMG
jgi:hypothetical protein